jgi:hypothetical protein
MTVFDVEVHVPREGKRGDIIVRLDEAPCDTRRSARQRGREIKTWLRHSGVRNTWMRVITVKQGRGN